MTQFLSSSACAAVVAGIVSLVIWKWNRKATKEDKKDNLTAGVRVLLYDRIKHLGKEYIMHGWVTAEELEDLIDMHKVYHNDLGGNGFLDNLMEQVKRLPIKN